MEVFAPQGRKVALMELNLAWRSTPPCQISPYRYNTGAFVFWTLVKIFTQFAEIIINFRMHTHTHTHTTILRLYGFVWDNLGELVPEETFTNSHLSWSSVIPYLLLPSNTIHGILPVQFTCLTVFFHNISPSFVSSTSYTNTLHFILHTFLHPITVLFSQHMPIPSCRNSK